MTTGQASMIPDSDPRFQQPEGWRWHIFTNPKGRKLRFGAVSPKSRIPDAVVVCLPGLSEFSEKYFETARDLLDRNLAFWILDWQGQGHSDRHLDNRHKRHSTGFDENIDDLHYFIMEYVKHASVHPDVGRIPLVMLGHSMGGNIGLRYLIKHPDIFACAGFSAPMTGIAASNVLPLSLAVILSGILKGCFNTAYIFGGKDWSPKERETASGNLFSSDPARAAVHDAWCHADPVLQVGNVTFGWLHHALRSCAALRRAMKKNPVKLPCLFVLAGHEKLVDNDATRKMAARMPQAEILELDDSLHEILMERDVIRDKFLSAFENMLIRNNVREKLKPF